jgi:hypothetical protein
VEGILHHTKLFARKNDLLFDLFGLFFRGVRLSFRGAETSRKFRLFSSGISALRPPLRQEFAAKEKARTNRNLTPKQPKPKKKAA